MGESVFERYSVVPPRIDDFTWVTDRLRIASRLLTFVLVQLRSSLHTQPGMTFRLRHLGFTRRDLEVYRLHEWPSGAFVSTFAQWVSATRINGVFDHTVNNKAVFPLLMRAAQLPHPVYFGSLGPAGFQSTKGTTERDLVRALRGLLERIPRIVIKPVKGLKGAGLLFLSRDEHSLNVNGTPAVERDLRILLARLGTAIVTEFVEQSEYASTLFPATTNTIRVLTLWDYAAGEPFVAAAAQRIGNSRSFPADNFRGGDGGLSAEVDVSTGALSRAATLDDFRHVVWFDVHPESGAQIEGIQVPYWRPMVRSLLDGARALAFAPCLAWDIVMTEDAFSVVEINGGPGLHVHQIHRPLLADPRVRDFYRFHRVS